MRYAGLFGVVDGGTISNVKVSGEVHNNYAAYKTEGKYEKLYIGSGGIAGYLKSGTISGCTNYTETTMAGEALVVMQVELSESVLEQSDVVSIMERFLPR
mgnify:CR=1 FL=1